MKTKRAKFHLLDYLWDLWCIFSIVGIWPRFIEPNLLESNSFSLLKAKLPSDLEGLKILQFSDLHLHNGVSEYFLRKLSRVISSLNPDIIVYTGDFLCSAKTDSLERLKTFLNTLNAPYGCYAVLGNHDYEKSISLNAKGEYDIHEGERSLIRQGFSRLFKTPVLAKRTAKRARSVPPNKLLVETLKETPFKLLNNETILVPVKGSFLNICGFEEYLLGRFDADKAFTSYNEMYPGILLLHNPDALPFLKDRPGDVVLCGHTHGGQVYLPFIWQRFTLMENMDFIRGKKLIGNKTVYINRGVGGVMTFRLRARPEILLLTLKGEPSSV